VSTNLARLAPLLEPQRDAIVDAWARSLLQVSPGPAHEIHTYCSSTIDRLFRVFRGSTVETFLRDEAEAAAEAARSGASLVPLALASRSLERSLVPFLATALPEREAFCEALLALHELGDRRLAALLKAQEEDATRRLVEAQDHADLVRERAQDAARSNESLRVLTRKSQHRAAQLELLSSVVHRIAPVVDPDHLLQVAATTIQVRMNHMYVAVVVLDNEGVLVGRWAGRPGVGRRSAGRTQGPAGGVIGRALRKKAPQVVPDVRHDADHHPDVPGALSEMVIPLFDNGDVVGALDFQSDREDAFDLDDVAAGETLADFLVVALRNARLLSESRGV
jgi:GAF domain-containing protein